MSDNNAEFLLPPLQEAYLSADQLEALCTDLEHGAEVLDISLKYGGATRAAPSLCTLPEAVQALLQRQVLGIQVRYRHAGDEWWDTLLWGEHGVRLVRVNHSHSAAL